MVIFYSYGSLPEGTHIVGNPQPQMGYSSCAWNHPCFVTVVISTHIQLTAILGLCSSEAITPKSQELPSSKLT